MQQIIKLILSKMYRSLFLRGINSSQNQNTEAKPDIVSERLQGKVMNISTRAQ